MKMLRSLSLALCLLCLSATPAQAAEWAPLSTFSSSGAILSLGRGEAGLAVINDYSPINPAGLSNQHHPVLNLIGSLWMTPEKSDALFVGLSGVNCDFGVYGFFFSQGFSTFAQNGPEIFCKQATFGLTLAPALATDQKIMVGARIRGMSLNYTGVYSRQGYIEIDLSSSFLIAIDLGFIYRVTPTISFGLLWPNLNSPRVSLPAEQAFSKGDALTYPSTLRCGLALETRYLTMAMDFSFADKPGAAYCLGGELRLLPWLTIRAGESFGVSTIGASFSFLLGETPLQIDYGQTLIEDDSRPLQKSLGLSIGL